MTLTLSLVLGTVFNPPVLEFAQLIVPYLSEPSLKNVVQLARVFSVTTDYLLEIEDSPTIRVEGLSEKDQKYLRSICQMFISYALDKEQ